MTARLPNHIDWLQGLVSANLDAHRDDEEAYKLAVETIEKIDALIEAHASQDRWRALAPRL